MNPRNRNKRAVLGLLLAVSASAAALADDPYTITISSVTTSGTTTRNDFAGLSFGQGEMAPLTGGPYLFDTNTTQSPLCVQVQTLCENMGLQNLRLGGSAVNTEVPYTDYGDAGIDALFSFAKALGINVEFSLRQEGSYLSDDETMASYVWSNYASNLAYFCIGNEPNYPGTYSSYTDWRSSWEGYATGIVGATTTDIGFGDPDTFWDGDNSDTFYNGESWTQAFIEDRANGNITEHIHAADQHHYVGDALSTDESVDDTISDMLSTTWVTTNYPWIQDNIFNLLDNSDWSYRITEANDHTVAVLGNPGDGNGASNSFGSALWALDYMSWMSRDTECWGVNFHNSTNKATDTIYESTDGGTDSYQVNPKACALLMFNQIHGANDTVPQRVGTNFTITNSDGINVTSYVDADPTDLWVTIINKTNSMSVDNNAERADVTIEVPSNFTVSSAPTLTMKSYPSGNDPTQLQGTVGGSLITNDAAWSGSWGSATVAGSDVTLTAYTAEAVIVDIKGSF